MIEDVVSCHRFPLLYYDILQRKGGQKEVNFNFSNCVVLKSLFVHSHHQKCEFSLGSNKRLRSVQKRLTSVNI